MASRVTIPDPRALLAGFQRAFVEASTVAANARIDQQVSLVRAGLKPDGSAQQSNTAKTKRAKLRRGVGDASLIADNRRLADRGAYKVSATKTSVRASFPYPQKILNGLRSRGYDLWQHTPQVKALHMAELKRRIDIAIRAAKPSAHVVEAPSVGSVFGGR